MVRHRRIVAVLGYSDGSHGLHPVCSARLARAAEVSRPDDVVILSGWARRPHRESEAELMGRAWSGDARYVLLDPGAGSTLGNVAGAAKLARALGARELVLVTSSWHARRARLLARAAAHGAGVRVAVAPARERGPVRARLRELACWTLVPLQATLARRRR